MNNLINQINAYNLELVDNDPARLDALEGYTIGAYYAYISARHRNATKRNKTR